MTTVLSMKTMIRCFLVSSERKEALGYEAWAQLKPSSSELACRVPRQVLCHVLCVTPVYPFSSASITGLSSLKRGSACFCLSFFFLFVDIVCCYFIALSTFYTYIQLQSYTKTIDSIVDSFFSTRTRTRTWIQQRLIWIRTETLNCIPVKRIDETPS